MGKRKIPRNALPMYSEIASVLLNRIQSGQYERGMRLPTEDQFVEMFDVSKITIRHALSQLTEEGLIVRLRGRGTFVSEKLTVNKEFSVINLEDTIRALRSRVIKSVKIDKLKVSETRIAGAIEHFFNLSRDDTIVRVQKVVWGNKVPYAIHESYLTVDFARYITKKKLYQEKSIIRILKKETGLVIGKGEMYFKAVALDSDISLLLHCQPLSPAINIEILFKSDSDESVELVNYFVKPEFFKYKVDMDLSQYDLI